MVAPRVGLQCTANLAALAFLAVLALALAPAALAQNFTTAEGGNVTQVNFLIQNETTNWQGFAGQVLFGTPATIDNLTQLNATGGLVNESTLLFEIDCDNPISATGFIFVSNSSNTPTGLAAGNLTLLDNFVGAGHDSGTRTFTGTSSFALTTGTITGVPTVFTFVNESQQSSSFREGYFNQDGNLVFATVIEVNLAGYNTSAFDYQLLVPAPNLTTVQYFVSGDITFTCPAAAPAAAGGGGGREGVCIVFWDCTAWGVCGIDGYQHRTCRERRPCPGTRPRPPETRLCGPAREETPEVISERSIISEALLRNIRLSLTPATGTILAPTMLTGILGNWNAVSVEDVFVELVAPSRMLAPAPAHPHPRLFWNALFGWADHGTPEAEAFAWESEGSVALGKINPRTETPFALTVTPPLLFPGTVELGVHAFSGPSRIASASVPFSVGVPSFGVYGSVQNTDVLTLYFVVDNRGQEGKSINIELALNKGKSTLVAEMLGPLAVPENRVAIFGHEYKLGTTALSADVLHARLITPEETQESVHALR